MPKKTQGRISNFYERLEKHGFGGFQSTGSTESTGAKKMPFFSHRKDESLPRKIAQGAVALVFKGPFVLAEKVASLVPVLLSVTAHALANSRNKDLDASPSKNNVLTKIKGGLSLGLQGTANVFQVINSTLFTGLSVLKQGTFTALSLITQRGRNGEKVNGEATWFGDQNKERLGLSLEIAKQAMKDITTSFKDLNEARTALQQGNEMDSKCFETPASTRDSVLSQDKTVVTSIASPALRNPEPGTPEIAAQTAQSTQQPSNQSLGNGRRPTEAPPPPPPRNNGLANMEANTPPGLPTSAPATPTTGRQAQQATVPGM